MYMCVSVIVCECLCVFCCAVLCNHRNWGEEAGQEKDGGTARDRWLDSNGELECPEMSGYASGSGHDHTLTNSSRSWSGLAPPTTDSSFLPHTFHPSPVTQSQVHSAESMASNSRPLPHMVRLISQSQI